MVHSIVVKIVQEKKKQYAINSQFFSCGHCGYLHQILFQFIQELYHKKSEKSEDHQSYQNVSSRDLKYPNFMAVHQIVVVQFQSVDGLTSLKPGDGNI